MNPLAKVPTEEQLHLLEVIYEGRRLCGGPHYYTAGQNSAQEVGQDPSAWPVFQWVEATLYQRHGLDARSLISAAPAIRLGHGGYHWVRFDRQSGPEASDKVRLTIAGMAHVPEAGEEVQVFLDVLQFLVQRERQFVPNPLQAVAVVVWRGEIREALQQSWALMNVDELAALPDLLSNEPSTWHCQLSRDESGWQLALSPFLRSYAGISNAYEYVQRIADSAAVRDAAPAPVHPSSLSLPEALDYLNAVWRVSLNSDQPLFRISRADAAAKLALECATADELESRLSAFAGILGQLRLPGQDGDKKLQDLKTQLVELLGGDAQVRALDAVDVLRDVIILRVWRQHPGTDDRGQAAAKRLGVAFPSEDWGAVWEYLKLRSVAALSAIREEIESIEEP